MYIRGLQAKIKEHKELVAQLQREKDVPRIKVSEAVADIQQVRTNISKRRKHFLKKISTEKNYKVLIEFLYIFPLKYVMEHQENDPLVRGGGNKGAGGFCPFACIKSGDWGTSEFTFYNSMSWDNFFISYLLWWRIH